MRPIPVAAQSKAGLSGHPLAGSAGLNPAGGCLLPLLSGKDLCFGLITRPEESYRVWCLSVIVKPRK